MPSEGASGRAVGPVEKLAVLLSQFSNQERPSDKTRVVDKGCDVSAQCLGLGVGSSTSSASGSLSAEPPRLSAGQEISFGVPGRTEGDGKPVAVRCRKPKIEVRGVSCTARWRFQQLSSKQIAVLEQCIVPHNERAASNGCHVVYLTWNGLWDKSCVNFVKVSGAVANPPWKTQGHALACVHCSRVAPTFEKLKFMESACPGQLCNVKKTRRIEGCEPAGEVTGHGSETDPKRLRVVGLARRLVEELSEGNVADMMTDHQVVSALREVQRSCSVMDNVAHVGGFKIGTLNVGGLGDKLDGLVLLDADVVALQELGVPKSRVPRHVRAARAQNATMSFGPTPAMQLDALGRTYTPRHLGVALFGKDGCDISRNDKKFDTCSDSGLRLSSWVVIRDGVTIHVHSIYMNTATSDQWSCLNAELASQVIARLTSLFGSNQVVLGDFQEKVSNIPEFARLLHYGWVSGAVTLGLEFTNVPSHGQARVLDDVLVSPELVPCLTGFSVREVGGFSTHSLLVADLSIGDGLFDHGGMVYDSPAPAVAPGAVADLSGLSGGEWWRLTMEGYSHQTAQVTYNAWLAALNKWLGTEEPSKGQCCRGSVKCHRIQRPPKPVHEYEPLTWRKHIVRKTHVYLKELHALQNKGKQDTERYGRLQVKLRALPLEEVGLGDLFYVDHYTAADIERVAKEHQQSTRAVKQRLMLWRSTIIDSVLDGSSGVFKWLKHGVDSIVILSSSVGALGTRLVAHPPQVLQCIHEYWQPILAPQDYNHVSQETIELAARAIGRCPLSDEPLSAQALFESAKSRPMSVAGLDQISLKELRELPIEAWEPLAHVFSKVEEGQCWPTQLLQVKWAPLSKDKAGEVTAVEKTRLISISSHVLRTWSSARAKQCTACLSRMAPATVFGGLPHKCTQDVLGRSALKWSAAQTKGLPFCELSLDCTRCFDTLDVKGLGAVAESMGLMPRVFEAFVRFSLQQDRILSMKGWRGPATRPSRGLPQGDGLSVVLAVIWGWALHNQVDILGGDLSLLVYLDDVSISAGSVGDVSRAFALTASYFMCWGVALNPTKCAVAYINQTEGIPESMEALERVSAFKLLGVNTGPEPTDDLLEGRIRDANDRLDRIVMLALPLNMVRKLVSVFVNPVLYGVSFCPCCTPSWQKLTQRVVTLCFGSTRYLASGPLIMLTSHRAHSWHPEMYKIREGMSVLQRVGRRPETRLLFDNLVEEGCSALEGRIPYWANVCKWLQMCGACLLKGGIVQLQDEVMLDFDMSYVTWQHGVRDLMRVHAYLEGCLKQRGLERINAGKLDSFLLHHVLIRTKRDTAQETYGSGSVITKDRMSRHKGLCEDT
eukprot:597725-Amphidinium_carterae.1